MKPLCAMQLQHNMSVLFVYALPGIGAAIALAVCVCLCASKACLFSMASHDQAALLLEEHQQSYQPVRTP